MIDLTIKCLKKRLTRDNITLKGYESEWQNIYDLFKKTADGNESNSALLIGPRGSGKTTLISSVLYSILSTDETFQKKASIVQLNGLIHTDDRLALKSATVQLKLENDVRDKVFGSFAENLSFLLTCLKAGDKKSKSVIFILEEFDLFCNHHNQTLLYNLFDVSQSAQTPVCVLGITCRLDVIELLEKRVKSRFSHRQIFLYNQNENFDDYFDFFCELLKLPPAKKEALNQTFKLPETLELYTLKNLFDPSKYSFPKEYVEFWNSHIDSLRTNNSVKKILQNVYDYNTSYAFLKSFLFKVVSTLDKNDECIKLENIISVYKEFEVDDKILLLSELSVLELCIVIAIKHHSEIYNDDPFNFEIIYNRFMKFSKTSSTMQGIERDVALKAFEYLQNLEFIAPITCNSSKLQKEFHMHRLLLTKSQIDKSITMYDALPTEVAQWAQSSLI